jgi:hypothetical protein
MSILVIIPTTAVRLDLIKRVIESYYHNNPTYEFRFVLVKNGTASDELYYEYDFGHSNVEKHKSYPGGNIAKATNVGLDLLGDEDYVILGEDDFIINQSNWIDVLIKIYKTVESPGCIGNRLHGNQISNHQLPSLNYLNDGLFEVFWIDGILFMESEKARTYRCDETLVGATEWADYCIQMIDGGFKNYYCKFDGIEHHSIRLAQKYEHAETKIIIGESNSLFYHKWKNTDNSKINYFMEMDCKEDG